MPNGGKLRTVTRHSDKAGRENSAGERDKDIRKRAATGSEWRPNRTYSSKHTVHRRRWVSRCRKLRTRGWKSFAAKRVLSCALVLTLYAKNSRFCLCGKLGVSDGPLGFGGKLIGNRVVLDAGSQSPLRSSGSKIRYSKVRAVAKRVK